MAIRNNTVLMNLGEDGKIKLDGSSIWTDTNNMVVNVERIEWEHGFEWDDENEYSNSVNVWVEHSGPWEIYTDKGFERAISKLVGCEVSFSEQGMQEPGKAHLEGEINQGVAVGNERMVA